MASMFFTIMEMGVPRVFPSKTPESISILSASFLWVVILLCPGRLLSSSYCMSSAEIASPAGQPSTITPNARPWDSPQVVILKNLPKLFPATLLSFLAQMAVFPEPLHGFPYSLFNGSRGESEFLYGL